MVSLSLGATYRVQKVLLPLKCACIPKLLQVVFNFSFRPLVYGTTTEMFLLLVRTLCGCCYIVCFWPPVPGWILCLWLNVMCSLFSTHEVELHVRKACLMC